ncbi:hypothetical protein [Soonwooa sp.]|uniref:hypothetical protein n=1 Tax=Soonwooa sp. TaxID=1938592 RepID=UPI00260A49A4|nr:hypothetical protein [Soonwooa sp.]
MMKNSRIYLLTSLLILSACKDKKSNEIQLDKAKSTEVNSTSTPTKTNPEQRISDIKNWYAEAQNSMKSSSKDCKKAEKKWVYKLDNELSMDFVNKATECNLPNEIKILTGQFNGYEWDEQYSYYFKNGKLFFVYYEVNSEACSDEYRIYYDENKQVIQILTKTNNCSGDYVSDSNTKLTDPKRLSEILEYVNKGLIETNNILNQKK